MDTIAHWKPGMTAVPAAPQWTYLLPVVTPLFLLVTIVLVVRMTKRRSTLAPPASPEWTLEPELQSRRTPRRVYLSRAAKEQLVLLLSMTLLATFPMVLTFLVPPAVRSFIGATGVAGEAVVEKVYTRLESTGGKHPQMVPRTHLVLSYTDGAPTDIRVNNPRHFSGERLNVHYLPSSPHWVVVDGDPVQALTWLPALIVAVLFISIFATVFFSLQPWNVLAAVKNGEIVSVKIETLTSRGKAGFFSKVTYTWRGETRSADVKLFDQSGIWPGMTATAFIDPRSPDKPVIYRACPLRVTDA